MQSCDSLKKLKGKENFMAKKTKPRAKKAKTVSKKKVTRKKTVTKKRTAAKKKTGAKRSTKLMQMSYSLSPQLQALVGTKSATRPQVVKKVWAYIKANNCQDAKNRRMIVPNGKLAEVIGSKPIDMLKLAGALNKHIK